MLDYLINLVGCIKTGPDRIVRQPNLSFRRWLHFIESNKKNGLDVVGPINHSSPEVRPAVAGITEADCLHLAAVLHLFLVLLEILHVASGSVVVLRVRFVALTAQVLIVLVEIEIPIPRARVAACRIGESSSDAERGLADSQSNEGG